MLYCSLPLIVGLLRKFCICHHLIVDMFCIWALFNSDLIAKFYNYLFIKPLTYVYAKQIGSSLYGRGILRPILLGIALKDPTPETLQQVVQFTRENDIFSLKS